MTKLRPAVADKPGVMRTTAWADYALIDSGDGRKLERYGPYSVVRPEPQCLWSPRQPELWAKADAVFDPSDGEDAGRWRFQGKPKETWPMAWGEVRYLGRFTAFRHLAFFPEQAANWAWLDGRVRDFKGGQPKVLNLFGYTGVASLVCAAAGAAVTHVDASKKAIGWARENATLSKLDDRPIRWICEDARRYVAREVRRGNRYDGIILDPPKYGRGPDGEIWKMFENLPELSTLCAELLSENASFLLLNAYAERISGAALAGLLSEKLHDRGGSIEWGELALSQDGADREIGMSFYARWTS